MATPMHSSRESNEQRYFFTIKTNLAAAVRDAAQDDIEFHLNEFEAMRLNTDSERLRRACVAAIAAHNKPAAAIQA
jgi:hypothetical protein